MTSARQFEANRRNSQKSTGPKTERGKRHSRRNAFRHGLCAETVIEILEDVEDYKAFEAIITVDYDPHTAVERELVLRLASLLWRIRRATAIDTDLFRMQAEALRDRPHEGGRITYSRQAPDSGIYGLFAGPMDPDGWRPGFTDQGNDDTSCAAIQCGSSRELARSFLQLAKLDDDAFVRLGRYEARLWRQFAQTLLALQAVRRHNDTRWIHRLASE